MKDVKHYTRGGMLWKGNTHKMPNGDLHTHKTHTKTSEKLYHYGELSNRSKQRAKA